MIDQLARASVGTSIIREGVSFFPVYLQQADPGVITGPQAKLEVIE